VVFMLLGERKRSREILSMIEEPEEKKQMLNPMRVTAGNTMGKECRMERTAA
jgi:hypothetical protein